ncbi:DUF3024 domain-containing protein [Salinispirillum marinum]|uniref:DUF3024 domain-containing protein n=2 Tax=Saccharospirillaceae TaxID=255527 RepID=A0ABV8BFR8_9GAMM
MQNSFGKRNTAPPTDFEHRQMDRSMQHFLRDVVPIVYRGPGEVRYRLDGRVIEVFEVQAHPVYPTRGIRLPIALLQGAESGGPWQLFFRGEQGHWRPFPADVPLLRLETVLRELEHDKLGVFW